MDTNSPTVSSYLRVSLLVCVEDNVRVTVVELAILFPGPILHLHRATQHEIKDAAWSVIVQQTAVAATYFELDDPPDLDPDSLTGSLPCFLGLSSIFLHLWEEGKSSC